MNTYKKHTGERSVIVNQISDKEICPERALVPSAVEGSGAEGPIFSSHPMSPSILTGRGAPARSFREKLVDGLLVIHLSRPQDGVWEIPMIRRVRIVLRLQARRPIPLIRYAAFALDASI